MSNSSSGTSNAYSCIEGAFVSVGDTIGTTNWSKYHWTSDHAGTFSWMGNFQIGVAA